MSSEPISRFQMHDADTKSLNALLAVDPVWVDLAPAQEAFGLANNMILHAGPPFSGDNICKPVVNSAAMAVLYEGWAKTEEEAENLVFSGEILLCPAQDYGVVVPLASVLTSSMAVHVVADSRNTANRVYAPLNGGSGPALRLGMAGRPVVEHLKWLNSDLAQYLRTSAKTGINTIKIADEALARGDDCHGRTIEATKLLVKEITHAAGTGSKRIQDFFDSSPGFFLNLWMAASKCILTGADEIPDCSVIVALGGNGVDVGLKISGLPDRWFTAPASPPTGSLDPGRTLEDRLGAIGDSAVVDALGLGAMTMHLAPAQEEALGKFMPESSEALGRKIMSHIHPEFSRSHPRTGLTARQVAQVQSSLAVSLGIIDREGKHGRIGGGISVVPMEIFIRALKALQTKIRPGR